MHARCNTMPKFGLLRTFILHKGVFHQISKHRVVKNLKLNKQLNHYVAQLFFLGITTNLYRPRTAADSSVFTLMMT